MPEPIGDIPVQISGDWSQLQRDLLAVEVAASASAKKIASAINTGPDVASSGGWIKQYGESISNWLVHPMESAQSAIGNMVASLGPYGVLAASAATALVGVGTAIGNLVLSEGAAAESMSNLAGRLNLTYQEAKLLSEMAGIAGVNIGVLSRASINLAKALEDSEGSGKGVAAALKKIGIDVGTTLPTLTDVLEKLAAIPEANARIAAANQIMGRGSIELEPLLRSYTDLKASVEALGGSLGTEMTQRLLDADDAADKLSLAWDHLLESVAATAAPAITAALDTLTRLFAGIPEPPVKKQIDDLQAEIEALKEDADAATDSVLGMFGEGFNYSTSTQSGQIAQKQAMIDMANGAKEARDRSKEYNDELDRSNRVQEVARESADKLAEKLKKELADEALKDVKKATEGLTKAFGDLGLKVGGSSGTTAKIDKLQGAVKLIQTAWQDGKVPIGDYQRALGVLHDEVNKEKVRDLEKQVKDLNQSYKDGLISTGEYTSKQQDLTSQIALLSPPVVLAKQSVAAFEEELGKLNAAILISSSVVAPNVTSLELYKGAIDGIKTTAAVTEIGNLGTSIGALLEVEERRLQTIINDKVLRGEAASAEIIALENVRLKMDQLTIASQALGEVYIGLNEAFSNVFDNLGKGLTDLIVNGGSIGNVLKGVLKSLEADIVGTLVNGLMEGLKNVFLESGIGQAISGFLTGIFEKLFGSLFDIGTTTAQVASDTANTSAVVANTAALATLTAAITGEAVAGVAGSAAGAAGSAAGGIGGAAGSAASGALGIVNAISGVASAVSSIIGNFQMAGMNKSLDIIVLHTLQTANDLANLRRDAWDREAHLMLKLDDMWRTLLNIYDFMGANLSAPLQVMGVPGLGPAMVGPSLDSAGMLSASGSRASVYVNAVNPSARSVTKALVRGLEEVGVKVR